MSTLSKWDATRKCEAAATCPSTGTTREWWRDQSRIDRTDWISAARQQYNEAPKATFDAVEFELRTYGLSELSKRNCQRRLTDLSVAQLKKLMISLQQRRRQYPAVSNELLAALATIYDARVISNEQ
jgi:hypothetical protein